MPKKPNHAVNHWWVNGSERIPNLGWHWDHFFEEHDDPKWGHNWGGSDWIRSPVSCARIKEMREGDIVVANQAGEGVVGLVYLDNGGYPDKKGGLYNTFDLRLKPSVRLRNSVPYTAISGLPNSKTNFEFVGAKFKQGTVFRINPNGFDQIVDLMLRFNPHQRDKIREFLAYELPDPEAVVTAIDKIGDLKKTHRTTSVFQRVIRDSEVGRRLKTFYRSKCQVCGMTIQTLNGSYYAEIHHLRPVGKPHNGKDGEPNTIVVCPHHHALFDLGIIAIDPRTYKVKHWNPKARENGRRLILEHQLDKASLNYQYRRFVSRTNSKKSKNRSS